LIRLVCTVFQTMAATDVQLSLSQSDQSTLDSLLRPHLRLEPMKSLEAGGTQKTITSPGGW